MKTTKSLIKLLPFDQEFKDDLLESYDTLDDDQRFSIQRAVWDLYDAVYQARLDENIKKAFEKAKKKEEKLDHDFYKRVRQQTKIEFEKVNSEVTSAVDLSSAREELSKILTSATDGLNKK